MRDGGYPGTVVLMHDTHGEIRLEADLVFAEAGVAAPKVARFAATHGFEGAEFLAGIPGHGRRRARDERRLLRRRDLGLRRPRRHHRSRGAAARAQARRFRARLPPLRSQGHGGDDVAAEVLGDPREEWFTAAWFRFPRGDGEKARARIKELLARRIATQPLNLPNAGSVFRNPPGEHAARLIEACGLKGYAIGNARISEKHANFIVNPSGKAHAGDIEALIEHARKAVRNRFGIDLVPEVRIVGEPL